VGLKPISVANWLPSVLWRCWLGHLACKNRPRNDLYSVEWDVKPLLTHSLTHSLTRQRVSTAKWREKTRTHSPKPIHDICVSKRCCRTLTITLWNPDRFFKKSSTAGKSVKFDSNFFHHRWSTWLHHGTNWRPVKLSPVKCFVISRQMLTLQRSYRQRLLTFPIVVSNIELREFSAFQFCLSLVWRQRWFICLVDKFDTPIHSRTMITDKTSSFKQD